MWGAFFYFIFMVTRWSISFGEFFHCMCCVLSVTTSSIGTCLSINSTRSYRTFQGINFNETYCMHTHATSPYQGQWWASEIANKIIQYLKMLSCSNYELVCVFLCEWRQSTASTCRDFQINFILTFSPSQINFSLDDLNMIFSAVSDIQTQKLYLATF